MATYFIKNAPDLDLNGFWSQVSQYGGPARGNRFVVVIPTPKAMAQLGPQITEELAYLCESAEMPGRGWMTTDYRYYGPKQSMPMLSEYNQFNCRFILRDDMFEKEYFDTWFEIMQPGSYFDMNYKSNYAVDIKVFSYGKSVGNDVDASYSMTLIKAWPAAVAPIPLSYQDNNYVGLEVSFMYKRTIREEIDPKPAQFELVRDQNVNTITREGGTTFPPVVLARNNNS
jgi:hypothetical protein